MHVIETVKAQGLLKKASKRKRGEGDDMGDVDDTGESAHPAAKKKGAVIESARIANEQALRRIVLPLSHL